MMTDASPPANPNAPNPNAPNPNAPGPTAPHRGADPPGLDAIRRFFRRRWIQGVWAWLCFFGRGVRAVWRWLDRNVRPIARGVEAAGDLAVRTSRGAVAVGKSAREIGGKVQGWGRERGNAGLKRIGQGMGRFGARLARAGTQAENVAESVEDLGETLTGIAGPDPGPRRPPRRPPSRARELPARRLPAQAAPALPAPAGKRPARAPDGALPEAIRERLRALGRQKRKPSAAVRELIVDICAAREWTSVGELSGWLGMNANNLRKRHLRPLLKAGRLRLRHPESKSHPDQGYGLLRR